LSELNLPLDSGGINTFLVTAAFGHFSVNGRLCCKLNCLLVKPKRGYLTEWSSTFAFNLQIKT
ncbi:hypothetical protein P7K49_026280, partial [Saguinus oedipus]